MMNILTRIVNNIHEARIHELNRRHPGRSELSVREDYFRYLENPVKFVDSNPNTTDKNYGYYLVNLVLIAKLPLRERIKYKLKSLSQRFK